MVSGSAFIGDNRTRAGASVWLRLCLRMGSDQVDYHPLLPGTLPNVLTAAKGSH